MGIFSEIPRHNQMDVLKKLVFKDFLKLKQCSQETVEITKNFRHPLYLKANEIRLDTDHFVIEFEQLRYADPIEIERCLEEPIRLKVRTFSLNMELSKEQEAALENFCRRTKLVANEFLAFGNLGEESPSSMEFIIELMKPKKVTALRVSHSIVLKLTQLESIKKLQLYSIETDESDLLLLTAPEIRFLAHVRNVSATLINTYLKQWMDGKRHIKELSFVYIRDFHMEMLKDIEFTVLWTPETHQSTNFHHLDMEELEFKRILSLKREEDGKKLIISFRRNDDRVEMNAGEYDDVAEIEKRIHDRFFRES